MMIQIEHAKVSQLKKAVQSQGAGMDGLVRSIKFLPKRKRYRATRQKLQSWLTGQGFKFIDITCPSNPLPVGDAGYTASQQYWDDRKFAIFCKRPMPSRWRMPKAKKRKHRRGLK